MSWVDITSFGALGDGTTDNTTIIQTLIDQVSAAGGGTVYVPAAPNYYRVTERMLLKSGVQLVGDGYGSWLKNDRTTSSKAADQSIIAWAPYSGTYSGSGTDRRIDAETKYNCNNITQGNRTITLTTASQASNFVVGDLVFIHNGTKDTTETDHDAWTYTDVNEVESSDSGTGIVTLRYPHYDSATSVQMARSSGSILDLYDDPIQLRKNTRVANLRLENHYNAEYGVFSYGGCVDSMIENLWVSGANLFSFNAAYRCIIRNVIGVVSQKLIDHAYWCGFNLFESIQINQWTTPTATDFKISLAGMTHDTTLSRFKVNAGSINKPVVRIGRSYRMTVRDSDFIGYGVTGTEAVLRLDDNGAGSYGPDGAVVDNCRIYCGSPNRAILYDNLNAPTPNQRNVIRNCSVNGTPTAALEITGVITGSASNSTGLYVENSKWPSLKITNGSSDSSVVLRNNDTKTQNYEVREGLNQTETTTGVDTTVKTYAIAQNACSATGGWCVRAWGAFTTGAGAGTRRIRLRLGSTNVNALTLEASANKSWFIEGTIINRSLATQSFAARRFINDGTGPDSTQVFAQFVGTEDFAGGALSIALDYRLVAGDTSILFRGWEVIPFGHDA